MIYLNYTIPKLDIKLTDEMKDVLEETKLFQIENPNKEWCDTSSLKSHTRNGTQRFIIYSNDKFFSEINSRGNVSIVQM